MSYRNYGPYDREEDRENDRKKDWWEGLRERKIEELRSKGYDVNEYGDFEVNGKARYVDHEGRVWDVEY